MDAGESFVATAFHWKICQTRSTAAPDITDLRGARGRSLGEERPLKSAGWLTAISALCVGGYDDNHNVANGGTDQSTDGANYIVVSAHARNDFAAAISLRCGEGDHGHVGARCV